MAFWKKSEDPWDIDPEKRKREQAPVTFETAQETERREEDESILSEIAGLFKKKPDPIESLPDMTCPWCGKEMTKGYLMGGRDRVCWSAEKPGGFFGSAFLETVEIRDPDVWNNYKTCWHCIPCRRLVVDVPEQEEETFAWDGNPPSAGSAEQDAEEEKADGILEEE